MRSAIIGLVLAFAAPVFAHPKGKPISDEKGCSHLAKGKRAECMECVKGGKHFHAHMKAGARCHAPDESPAK